MTNIGIPASVTNIGDYAFIACDSLTNFFVDAGNPAYSSLNGVLFDKGLDLLIQFPAGLTNQGYDIPDSVASIGKFAFLGCFGLTNISIPGSVKSIGNGAFAECWNPINITIPSSVTNIGEGAFANCGLTNVSIPNGLTSIESNSFMGCSSLASVILPDSVVSIGSNAFYECGLTNVTLPGSVTSIGGNAFYGCRLTTVTIPNSVTNIGFGAFLGCPVANFSVDDGNPAYSSLNGVLFDKAQDALIQYPMALTNRRAYTIPDSVISIGEEAFYDCYDLTSVTIPSSVTSIGDNAFALCNSLIAAYFLGDAPPDDGTVFSDDKNATALYLPGTTGWGASFAGVSTRLWYLARPEILNDEPSLGERSNQFGFTVSGPATGAVVVQATADLNNPVWVPIATNSLSNGTFYFSDPDGTNYPARFYRLSPP
jgi:hypothetical protein